ncbi:RNA polymerase sigma-70 factor [Niastella caeni]|uniref:RNA polymerase sigma-70 factor n=1 Tax=Niastella caeni TaxID=2569763 RepID=A0A4S8I2R8_9BACT|nr:RNA polymerase sigma-70 factor [Niastella caeni]THU40232.1 RNA polymerase sigma-70 factor [Niastella caeni]
MKIDAVFLQQLQQQVAKGDQRSFEDLYRLFYARLLNFALLYVHKREIAEEVVNDVMISIWNKQQTLQQVQHLETYIFTAVRNRSLNYLTKYSTWHVLPDATHEQGTIINLNDPEKQLEWKEISFHLNQAIDQLPEQCRTVFKLIKEEGFRYKQVAEILNISARTVETQLFRAIKKLDKVIAVYLDKSQRANHRTM